MLVVFGLDANVGRKRVAAALTRAVPGTRLLVELGVSGTTWSMAGAEFQKRTPTLETIYEVLRERNDGMRRVRVHLDTVVGALSDLESARPISAADASRRDVVPVVRAPVSSTEAAERALEFGSALVELFVQLERSSVLGPTTVLADAGWVAPGLVGQAAWAAAASDLVLVVGERPVAIASLGYFERAFPQARVWVVALAAGRRRRRLAEVARFALRARHGVEVIAVEPDQLGSGTALEQVLEPIVMGSAGSTLGELGA
ncbi:hypothetical protein Afer_0017 [Acidimicrobium ferrooxidans DSM 10331]|uniref:Uncharacterized protein n=1 Tax=Acidimicrobium ferrooxidans (strain DSM 10331 / JCM 15462 / NBRC 103882 / ICP) TaxID=525909 RepID=C7M1E3_ACIFD|nr:hypothetical protein [Acidimicrobium ferrooxidans]ACU52992.1 hypothetical protein Afer_0017 [Acidimicrobium ferrooxidans DSM 10331]